MNLISKKISCDYSKKKKKENSLEILKKKLKLLNAQ